MKDEELLSNREFAKCVEFHGHICPGLSIGFQAAKVLMTRLGARKSPDEELVAVVETDACGADAIQVMTGCTFGKGNFIFKNYGKHAFSLVNRKKGKAMRVCLRPDAFKVDSEYLSIFEKVQNDKASSKELEQFKQFQRERVKKILDAEAESLFKFEKILPDIYPKAQVTESGICDFCKEPTKVDLLRNIDNKKVCILCADQHGLNDHK
jgi:formylmethanofuran dehydrogenase subunit E